MTSFFQDSNLTGSIPVISYEKHFFPKLKPDELVKCLSELGINVTQEEIIKPEKSKETTRRILEFLSEICTGVPYDDVMNPAFEGLSVINYPELHEESIPLINSLRSCSKMMDICDIHDFTIKDFINPSAGKFRRHLSGIVNFAKFREERIGLFSKLTSTRNSLIDYLNQVRDKNESMTDRLNQLKQQSSEEEKLIIQLENECKSFEKRISETVQEQTTATELTLAMREENDSLKKKIHAMSMSHEHHMEAKQSISSQIVSSPEKFRKQILEVGQQLQTEQKDSKIAERKARELSAWIVHVDESQNEVTGALESCQEVRLEVERQKALLSESETLAVNAEANRAALTELDQNVNQLSRQAHRVEEKLSSLRSQAKLRQDETSRLLESLHLQLIEAESFRLQVKVRAERTEADATNHEKETEVESAVQDQELQDIATSYQRLERIITNHLKGVQRVIGEMSDENLKPSNVM